MMFIKTLVSYNATFDIVIQDDSPTNYFEHDFFSNNVNFMNTATVGIILESDMSGDGTGHSHSVKLLNLMSGQVQIALANTTATCITK